MDLQGAWYQKADDRPWWLYLLSPLALMFWLISNVRKSIYRSGLLRAYSSSLPVIVVGNISIGGNGKTPVVLSLVDHFTKQGIKCAVLSRGYGGNRTSYPYALTTQDNPIQVGDEPALIRRRFDIPVVIDPKRARGAQFIEGNTDAQVIICDDGMQHYALSRDIEICVMDSRGIGNGYLLPMGPLREGIARLKSIDLLVYNGSNVKEHRYLNGHSPVIMSLEQTRWINVQSGESLSLQQGLKQFSNATSIAALAAIGDPKRFFSSVKNTGLVLSQEIGLPDHHQILQNDIPDAEIVLMTEKDAVKCQDFATHNCWYLEVEAQFSEGFYSFIDKRLAQINKE